MRHRIILAIAIVIFATALTVPFFYVYFLREGASGDVLWDSTEAYFFIGFSRRGLEVNYVRYPWFSFVEGFGAVESPDDDCGFLLVIHVTSNGVEDHVIQLKNRIPGSGPNGYAVYSGQIYASFPAIGGPSRWDSDHFTPATGPEQLELLRLGGLSQQDFQNRQGWSKRGFSAGPVAYNETIHVGNKFNLTMHNFATRQNGRGTLIIDVMRPGKGPERILERSIRWEKVNRAEYAKSFSNCKW